MLTILRINTVLQFLIIIAVFVALRILFLINELPLLSDELIWVLTGQKLSDGFSLYSEVFVTTAPFTAYLYQIVYNVVGVNPLGYEIFASLLVFSQVIIFSNMVKKRQLFNEFTYIPAIIFTLLTFLSFDFLKLSPPLIANVFVLLGINNILKQISRSENLRDDVFEGSLFFGVAALFDHSAMLFIIWALIVLGLYTSFSFKQAIMVFLGWTLPLLFMGITFYFTGNLQSFIDVWLLNFNKFERLTLLSVRDIIISFTIPSILALLGIYKILREPRFNSFKNRTHQSLILFGIFSFFVFILSGEYTPANLFYLITPLAFFIAAFFQISKKIILPEILFILFTLLIIIISYSGFNNVLGFSSNQLTDYRLDTKPEYAQYAHKKLFVTGDEIGYYQHAKAATGYLDWRFAREYFENTNNYMNISKINQNLSRDLPDLIIDNENVMPGVFEKIPALKNKYKSAGNNIYEQK